MMSRHEFEQAPGVGNGQGSLACCSPWGHKELDTTEWLNWSKCSQWTDSALDQSLSLKLKKVTKIPIHFGEYHRISRGVIGNILLIVAGRALAIIFKEIIKTQVSINKSMKKSYSMATQCNTIQQQKLDEQGYSPAGCWMKKTPCRKAHALGQNSV